MATRIRDGLPGKEKTLPRQANPEQCRTSPTPSPSPSRPVGPKSRSTLSDKNVPTHPKPTRTVPTVNQQTQSAPVRKPASAAATSDKPSLPGRRLINKAPLSASQSSRTLQKDKALRASSSFSGTRSSGTTTQKGASNRILKTAAPKDVVKKQTSNTRPPSLMKRNAATKSNGESSADTSLCSSVMSSPDRLQDPEIVHVPHPQEDDSQSYMTDEEVPINYLSRHITNEQELLDALREVDDDVVQDEEEQQTENHAQTEPDIHDQEDIKIIESLTSEVDNQDAADDNQEQQEQLEDNLEVKAEDEGKEEGKDATEAIEKKEEDQVVNLRETTEVKEHIALPEPTPKPEPAPAAAPAAAAAPAPAAKQTIGVQGKKETSALSNETIEETANKLREQRKNRVRALAGAFESVMH